MENPIKMDDLGVQYLYFWKHPYCCTIIHVHMFFSCRRCLCFELWITTSYILHIYNIFTNLQFIRILYGDHPSVVCSFVI